jgi:hypothetical protein
VYRAGRAEAAAEEDDRQARQARLGEDRGDLGVHLLGVRAHRGHLGLPLAPGVSAVVDGEHGHACVVEVGDAVANVRADLRVAVEVHAYGTALRLRQPGAQAVRVRPAAAHVDRPVRHAAGASIAGRRRPRREGDLGHEGAVPEAREHRAHVATSTTA